MEGKKVTYLNQDHFKYGPYLIDKPGHYCLAEDIILNFLVPGKENTMYRYNPPMQVNACPIKNKTKNSFLSDYEFDSLDNSKSCPIKDTADFILTQSHNNEHKNSDYLEKKEIIESMKNNQYCYTRPFKLGFSAGIIVTSPGKVVIDLNGKTIRMNPKFFCVQRFFSIFQLNISIFRDNAGPVPADAEAFKDYNDYPSEIKIVNGKIGLSSHCGVIANRIDNLTIQKVDFEDMEVGCGIFNACSRVSIVDCSLDNKNLVVPINGNFSALNQNMHRVQQMLKNYYNNECNNNEDKYKIPQTLEELQKEINRLVCLFREKKVYSKQDRKEKDQIFTHLRIALVACRYYQLYNSIMQDLECNNWKKLTDIHNQEFVNYDCAPDGSAFYGFSFVNLLSEGPGVGNFAKSVEQVTINQDITLSNPYNWVQVNGFQVKNVTLAGVEIPCMIKKDKQNRENNDKKENGYDRTGVVKMCVGELGFASDLTLKHCPFFDLTILWSKTLIDIEAIEKRYTDHDSFIKTINKTNLGTWYSDVKLLDALVKVRKTMHKQKFPIVKSNQERALMIKLCVKHLETDPYYRDNYVTEWGGMLCNTYSKA